MDSDKSPNETELTSTMGKMLSVPNKEEKSDSNDFTPTSSTDANTNVVGTPIVSDDPISSTSSDSDPNKQKSQKPEEIDETDRAAAATDETESDFLEISMMSGSSTEKITENVDDLVQDLETLLGESTDTFTVPVRTKDVEPPGIDSSPIKLQSVVSEPTVDDEVTSNTALVEETQSSCSQTVVIESQPEDSTSKLEETLPEDTETKTEENQPKVAKSNIEEIQSEDTGTNIEECQPEATKSNIEDSQSKDTGTNIEECQPKDTESKIEECQREDTVSKIEECQSEDTKSNIEDCQSEDTKSNIEESQSEDAGTNIEECQPEDTKSKIEDCQSEDTKSNIEESQSEDAGTNIEECQPEDTESKIEDCQSEDTKSNIEESQSEHAGTNIEECQHEDTESKIEECQPEDSESKIEQSHPKETRGEIEATQSEDTDDKIETIGTEIPTIDKNTDDDQHKKEEDVKTIEEFTENIEVPETSNTEKVVVNTTTEPTSLATESIEDNTISEETNKEENIDAIQSELTKAEENIIQPNSELTEKEEGEKCDMEGSEESNSTSNTEEEKLDSLEKPKEESDCSDKDTGSSSENIESQPKNDTILNSETINTKENKCSEEIKVIEAKVVENNTVERALVVKEILEEAECSSEDVTPVGMEDDKIKNVDLPSEHTEIEIPKCQSDDHKLSETTIESSGDCIIEGSIKDKQEEISDISTNQNEEQLPDCTVMKSCVSNLKEECSLDKISPIEDNSAISEDPGIQNEHKSEDPAEQDDQNIEVQKEQKTEDLVVTSEQKSEDLKVPNEQKSEELKVQNEELSIKLEETAESVVNIDMSEEKTTNECEKPVVEEKKEDLETTTSKESGSIPIPESEEIEEIQSQDEVVSSDISDDSCKNQLQEQVADTKEDNTSSVEPPSIIEEQKMEEQTVNIETDIPEVSSSLKDTEDSKEVKDETISEKIDIQEREVVLSEESQTKDAEMDLKNKELDQTVEQDSLPKEASPEVCVQKVMEKEEMKSVEEAPKPKDVEELVELPDNSDKGIEELPTCSELTEATESLPVEENAVENPEIVEEKEETISEEQITNFESEEQEAVANLIEETNKNIQFDEEVSEETQAVAHLLEANDNSFSDLETPTQTQSDKKDMIHQQSDVLISGMDNENSNLPNNEGEGSINSEVPTTFEGSMPDMEDILANSPSNLQMDNEENLETILAVASLQTNIDEQQLSEKEIREMEALRMAVASITDTCEPNYNTLEGASDIIESVPQEDGDIKSSVIEEPLNPESGVPELLEEEEKVSEDVKLSQQPSTSDILDEKEVVAKSPEVEENKEVIEETVQKSNKDSLPTPIEEEDNEAKSAQKSPKAEEKNAQKEESATKVESLQKEEQLQKPFPKKPKLVEPLTITIDEIEKHREKDKPYSPKVKIKPIKVPDDEVSTTSEAESSVKGSLKMTITKQSDKMHSILKVYNPNEEEDEEEATESHTQLEEPIPKLIIKQKMQQVEQQHSPKMTTRSSRQVYSPTRSSSPRITVKPVVKPNEVSPLKITLKSAIKPDETANKRHSPKTTRSTKEETSERVASPKVTIKPIIKPVESDQVHSPKLIIKPIAKPSESEVVTPKVTIKPIAKPSEAEKSEISTPKVTIKPIARPSNEAEKFEPTTPKVTIKPIKRPLEDDSNEDRPNPKIIIKPVIKPIEIETEQVLTKLETGRSSPKISIKPIVKPQDCQQTDNEDNKERIVLKINKGNLPTPSKDAKKREHPVEEEKLAKIKLKFSREGGHPHIVQQEEDVNRKLRKDSAHAGDENKKRVHEDKGVVEKNKKLKTGTDSPLTENLRSRHKGSPLQEPDNNTEEDVKIIETKLDSPIVISEDSRSQHSADCVIIDDSSDSLIASATKSQDNMAQSGTKDTAISPAAVGNATTPTPRKRGRPRKVPLEVREEYIEPAPEPVAEEPPPKKEPPPVAQNTSTRPKRSCRGQNVIATLGIKPRKPRGGGKGKGGKVNMGDRVPMKPKKEPKLSKARLKLLQKSAEEQLKEPNLETDENQPSTSSSVKKPESPIVISTESEEDEKQVTEDAKSIEDTSKVAVASPDSTQKITEPTTITEIQEIETEAISSSLPTESKIPKRKSYGRRGKSKGRGKYQKLAVEESNQEVESSTQDTSLTITEDVVDVVEETNKNIETSDSVSPNFDKTRTKSTDKRKLSVEKEETVKKVKVETCVVEKVIDKCEESTEKKEEKVEEVKEGEQELTSLTNKEDKKESSTAIPESKQDQPDPDTKQQTPPLPADTNKAEDRVSLEKKLNLLLPESITEPNPTLPEVKTDSTPPEVETNVISEVLPVLAPPVSESVSPGGKVATATASSSKIPEVVMVDEETRMSADANSRAQTPARQIAAPSVDMVEESQSSVQSSATTESSKTSSRPNRSRIEINHDSLGDIISADQLAEYYWNNNGPFMLQEQVAQFLGIKSFKRKYPNITRRMVDMQERDFIRESALATEAMCDLGLTAVNSADILDIMFTDFQDKYEEYCKHQREKQAKELINKQKALNQFSNQEKSKLDITEQAVQSAAQWNVRFNKVRKEQRKASMDLQTLTVHYPKGRMKQINKPKIGHYPVALVPGQFTDYYQEFTPTEINNLPLNTMCYNEINIVAPDDSDDSDDNSDSDSDSSTSSSGSSGSSSSIEDCKSCKTNVKKIPVK